jgi:catechol 2,3-dioxygenase-like lactoylglutathione lyase family enzyme
MRIVGLDHVQLAMPASREQDARAFYGGVLGLAEITKPSALCDRGGCWFTGRGVVLHLGVEDNFSPARKAHPAFVVADLRAARRDLEAAGVGVIEDDALGLRRFFADDPFGNRIEFIEDPEN